MREACDLIVKDSRALMEAVRARAEEHRRTPMIGRTHGVHAEPMTFGVKLALWYAELQRDLDRVLRARDVVSVGKISGAVGTFAHLDPAIEAQVCERSGLEPAPVSSQVIQRDRHAELMTTLAITAASLEKFALEIRGLQKTEIGEVEEPFGKGQKGSSAMPHKRNPIGCEQITGLARLVRANAMAALENVALWHERDISHSSVERVILPDSFIALDHMLRRFTRIVNGMVVYPDRMRENLERSRGVVFSGTVLLELARRGISREQAYEWVQRNAMRSFHEQKDFKALLLADPDLSKVLTPAEIERAFDLERSAAQCGRDLRASVHGRPSLPARATERSGSERINLKAKVFVTLKPSVFDPQGRTIAEALHSIGYGGVGDVRQGKYFELELDADRREGAGAGVGGGRQAARQSGDRELSDRSGSSSAQPSAATLRRTGDAIRSVELDVSAPKLVAEIAES